MSDSPSGNVPSADELRKMTPEELMIAGAATDDIHIVHRRNRFPIRGTKAEKRARRILDRVHAGSVYWNCCDRVSPRLPWSGWRDSGIGLTLSTHGIRTFTRTRAWHLRFAD